MSFDLPADLWSAAAAAGRIPWPLQSSDDAQRLIAHCGNEALLPILFAAPPTPLIEEALTRWRALDFANRRRTETIAAHLRTLPDLLGDDDYILLKGSDVAYRIYPSPELRPCGDIDVLVQHDRIDAVCARLEQRGLKRIYSGWRTYSRRWPDRKYDLGDVSLEVHHSIVNRSRATIDYEELWHSRIALRLSDVDAFLVAVMNIVKDDMAVPLLRYVDLWLMLRQDPSLVSRGAEVARRWRIVNAFTMTLRALAFTFPDLPLPYAPLHVERMRAHISPVARFWRKWRLIDGMDQRAAYAVDMVAGNVYGWRHSARRDRANSS